MTDIRRTTCPYDCPASCGLLATIENGRVAGVAGDPEHPASKGLICKKMQQYQLSVNSPNRILFPMRRTGNKGEGKFEPITWEEAVREIAGHFRQIIRENGPLAILPSYYSGTMGVIQRKCGDAFFNRLGARPLILRLCANAKGMGYASVMGQTPCLEPEELKSSDLILVWSSNVKATRLHVMPVLKEARAAGKKVLLIEACAREMDAYCDETILIRPGTDGALALAMMHVLEEKGLADEVFLRERCEGYEAFLPIVRKSTPKWAEQITGIPEKNIRRLALFFGQAKAPAILLGSGFSRYGNGGMTSRLITVLSAFTGAWGKPGGGICAAEHNGGPFVDAKRVTRPDFRKVSGPGVNINCLGSALTAEGEDAVKAFFVYGGNPVGSVCDQKAILKGLMREDLFTVVHERFLTDTARYADILLPAVFSVEQTDCFRAYGYRTFSVAKKLVEPQGECKSNWELFGLLAEAMGFEEPFFKRTEEEMLEELLSHPEEGLLELTEKQWKFLRENGTVRQPFGDHGHFKTPSGKLRIVNQEEKEPVPCYKEPYGGAYPLSLISIPDSHTLNSIFLERRDLVQKRGPAALMLHPLDAAERKVREGDMVTAWNDLAEVDFRAVITDRIAKGTAAVSGIYSSSQTGSVLLFNALNHERLSDMEATTLNDNRIDVKRRMA